MEKLVPPTLTRRLRSPPSHTVKAILILVISRLLGKTHNYFAHAFPGVI